MSDPLKRPAPLSVRLTQAERYALLARAGGLTLSAYVKQVLFDGAPALPRGSLTVANRQLLAHLLATLGASRLSPNLDRLAREADLGELSTDQETTARILAACDDVRLMHNALMRGLGKREKPASDHEKRARHAFAKVAGAEDDE